MSGPCHTLTASACRQTHTAACILQRLDEEKAAARAEPLW